ncbi:GNAT family N-acetyltransferase [Dongshaea marina]|uniref:GNAT family N-acetyltransferase n=1 Tax=Dongshaea marina TaxID=2047966 RepID=UPI00131F15DF|nr:GNAT family N-acetyltransferase [Dongshaea marina]
MQIDRGKARELHWLPDFYHECGYGGTFDGEDEVFFIGNESKVHGVVRIATEQGALVLWGMLVHPDLRRQAIGSRLLSQLQDYLESKSESCFCLPHDYLAGFYGQIGFQSIESSAAPEFLSKKMNRYKEQGLNIVLMERTSTG